MVLESGIWLSFNSCSHCYKPVVITITNIVMFISIVIISSVTIRYVVIVIIVTIVIVIINAQYLTKYAKSAQKENEFYETPYSGPFLFQLYIYIYVCVCIFFFLVIDTMEIKSNTQGYGLSPQLPSSCKFELPFFLFIEMENFQMLML